MLKSYLKKITETSNRGDAREESFYGTLSELLDSYAESTGRKNIHVTTLSKKTEAGNPDFRVWDGNHKQEGSREKLRLLSEINEGGLRIKGLKLGIPDYEFYS